MNSLTTTSTHTFNSYIIGFIGSIVLSIAAYVLNTMSSVGSMGNGGNIFTRHQIIFIMLILACAQVLAQLKYFVHLEFSLKKTSTSRLPFAVFLFTVFILTILIGGSLWIMYHLNYAMSPHDMTTFMLKDEGMQR